MEELLDKLLLLPLENEVVEFKEAKSQFDKDKLGQYFSALANEANLKGQKQSWLVFGVSNNKSIVGTTISNKQINEYK
ncbi:MAG: ATP-binding protein, partial [Bacteroidales bacterium]|nr:ATP-binding protein [Bacteroidales bacterium]